MEDLAAVAGFAVFLATVFATIITIYLVKVARRTNALMQALQRETECRIREKYELPPPTPVERAAF
jgi:hypothetical protein